MRSEIRPWEGKLIRFQGIFNMVKTVPSGSSAIMIQEVEICLYDEKQPETNKKVLDHVWLHEYDQDSPLDKLSKDQKGKYIFTGVGRICLYRRKNGSYDYGIKCIRSHSMYLLIKLIKKNKGSLDKNIEIARTVLDSLKNKCLFFPINIPYGQFKKEREQEYTTLLNWQNASKSRINQSKQHQNHGQKVSQLVLFKGRPLRNAKGFKT